MAATTPPVIKPRQPIPITAQAPPTPTRTPSPPSFHGYTLSRATPTDHEVQNSGSPSRPFPYSEPVLAQTRTNRSPTSSPLSPTLPVPVDAHPQPIELPAPVPTTGSATASEPWILLDPVPSRVRSLASSPSSGERPAGSSRQQQQTDARLHRRVRSSGTGRVLFDYGFAAPGSVPEGFVTCGGGKEKEDDGVEESIAGLRVRVRVRGEVGGWAAFKVLSACARHVEVMECGCWVAGLAGRQERVAARVTAEKEEEEEGRGSAASTSAAAKAGNGLSGGQAGVPGGRGGGKGKADSSVRVVGEQDITFADGPRERRGEDEEEEESRKACTAGCLRAELYARLHDRVCGCDCFGKRQALKLFRNPGASFVAAVVKWVRGSSE